MAEVVLGLAASHGPPVTMPASQWHMLREKDINDKRMDYQALLKVAKPNIDEEWTEERMQERYETVVTLLPDGYSNYVSQGITPCGAHLCPYEDRCPGPYFKG